jgi:beta-galactosidase/beta-glucuronidase
MRVPSRWQTRVLVPPLSCGTHLTICHVYAVALIKGTHASGYTPFSFALDKGAVARLAATSTASSFSTSPPISASTPPRPPLVLSVRADATRPDGWWYDGGGLYRRVRLVVLPVQHLALLGGSYMPSTVTGAIDTAALVADAEVSPSITMVNRNNHAAVEVEVTVTITSLTKAAPARTGTRKVVGVSTAITTLAANAVSTVLAMPKIPLVKAHLWSVSTPTLYEAAIILCPLGANGKSRRVFMVFFYSVNLLQQSLGFLFFDRSHTCLVY